MAPIGISTIPQTTTTQTSPDNALEPTLRVRRRTLVCDDRVGGHCAGISAHAR
jgi:hypothetical protein